ncbi:hypothetical protein [Tautonia plasticadhaerens]|uniref:Uncharacterized protein n=1 Tax=Tautonia plasticadhaerens TaxID=2527974 RepID=A0A518HDK0_9BACT|nr:hypothetical protein [Tautonia plasticadhaerens]QDV38937.1 hypothetical protein ElP_68970 [Tautonia plasticadhaerens]
MITKHINVLSHNLTHMKISALNFEGSVDLNENDLPWIIFSAHRGDPDNPAEAMLPLNGPATIATIQQLGLAAINATEADCDDRSVE